jgi:5'-deoxynucleotidase YfbR-like HD superfamily hydrolase
VSRGLIERIGTVRKAAYIKRFHTVPTVGESQTVGAHSWGVATLLNELWPHSSKGLLLATLYHDVAEVLIGDIPATTKWAYPDFAEAVARVEADAEEKLGIHIVLNDEEKKRLKICDMLELVIFASEQIKLGNHYFEPVFENGVKYLWDRYSGDKEYHKIFPVIAWAADNRIKNRLSTN